MLSFRVDDADAADVQRWAERLGVDRSELLRDAVRRHLNQLASEEDAVRWEDVPLDEIPHRNSDDDRKQESGKIAQRQKLNHRQVKQVDRVGRVAQNERDFRPRVFEPMLGRNRGVEDQCGWNAPV